MQERECSCSCMDKVAGFLSSTVLSVIKLVFCCPQCSQVAVTLCTNFVQCAFYIAQVFRAEFYSPFPLSSLHSARAGFLVVGLEYIKKWIGHASIRMVA